MAAGLLGSPLYLVVAISLLLTMLRRGEISRLSVLFFLVPPLA